jgi:DNA-directed RNA polymerase specialized sigma24 family protein
VRVSRYTPDELLVLLYEYEELREVDNKAWITVRLIDLWRSYDSLTNEHKEVILLMGLFGYSSRTVGDMLKISHTTATKRFIAALDTMLRRLNGGI